MSATVSTLSPAPGATGLAGEERWHYNRWLKRWRAESRSALAESGRPGSPARDTVSSVPFDDSDLTLVERVKAGDVRAFEMLHRRYHPRIYRFAFLRVGNTEDAADIAATTFCRALNSLGSYKFRRSPSIYPWLHRIAGNLVVDLLRERPRGGLLSLDAQAAEDVDSFLDYLPADGPSPQELVERGEVQAAVREAIDRLPADQARAVALRFLGDLSLREIAVELDRSEGAVKSLLHRALQGLRQHLKQSTTTARAEVRESGLSRRQERAEKSVPEVIHLHQRNS